MIGERSSHRKQSVSIDRKFLSNDFHMGFLVKQPSRLMYCVTIRAWRIGVEHFGSSFTDHVQQQSVSMYAGASSEVPEGLLYPLGEVGIIGFLLRRLERSRRRLLYYIFILL